ncbi:MAG: S8 family serine peptidase [Bdellovibrionota bacterium]
MMKLKSSLWTLTVSATFIFSSTYAHAELRVRNARELRNSYGLSEASPRIDELKGLKVAILDNSFEGFLQNRDSLPESAEFIRGPLKVPPVGGSTQSAGHGLLMAQVVWAMTGSHPEGPKFYLVDANGLSNLRAAIDTVINLKVDIVLYASTWETGGNYDGQGFINAAVTRAARAGILWVNAAGNDHGMTYTGRISTDPKTGALRLPGDGGMLSFTNKLTNNPVKLTLSWTDYKNEENEQTQKDLDWELQDWTGKRVALKNLSQGSKSTCGETPSYARGARENSLHPREQDEVQLQEGVYHLRVLDCSGNFVQSDRIRLVVQSPKGDSIEMHEANGAYEINPPADNDNVITIGDLSPVSSRGPTLDGRMKPDFRMRDSRVEMSDGLSIPMGSSVASAIFAGIATQLMSQEPRLSKDTLIRYQKRLLSSQSPANGVGPEWRTPDASELGR